ncbi:Fur family transcriptional regulator [Euzebya tangerina]|uniref:Fur family transcriptional regulator n=1 Tax=Euzebya tangerina TaxID=591198 RepID=UPI000E323290|nr:Fur family transcriptional regulator [Euzebya tangerina]
MAHTRTPSEQVQPAPTAGRLREAGLRATQPRRALLDWLDATAGHHAAEGIVEGTGLPKATVYHVLAQLREAGLVLVAETGSGGVLYETAARAHDHFVCQTCEVVIDVPRDDRDTPIPPDLAEPSTSAGIAMVDHAVLILKGTCQDCA